VTPPQTPTGDYQRRVSVGEADFVKTLRSTGRSGVLKIATKPGRPLAYGKIGAAHFSGRPAILFQ
jgi:molybdopterin molybdotransferase